MPDAPPQLRIVAITHQGLARDHNEDAIAVNGWVRTKPMKRPEVFVFPVESPVLCLVADGMGGYSAGEIASRHTACRLAEETDSLDTEESIVVLLQRVNNELFDQMALDAGKVEMGTTVAGLLVTPLKVVFFNVGDSRVFARQNGFLRQLSMDDTPLLSGSQGLARQEADSGARASNRLTQSLGGARERIHVVPHAGVSALQIGQRYLVCTDGLTDMLDLDTIEASFVDDDATTVAALFDRAMKAGGLDNLSILLVHLEQGVAPAAGSVQEKSANAK